MHISHLQQQEEEEEPNRQSLVDGGRGEGDGEKGRNNRKRRKEESTEGGEREERENKSDNNKVERDSHAQIISSQIAPNTNNNNNNKNNNNNNNNNTKIIVGSDDGGGKSGRLDKVLDKRLIDVLPLLPVQNTLILNENETAGVFLSELHRQRIRSCVVKHTVVRCWCRKSESYSFCDVRDFSYYVMMMHRTWRNKSFTELLSLIKNEKIGNIANVSKRTPFVRHDLTDTVSNVCAAFKPCCRVPVFDGKTLVRVMSPADLLTILDRYDVLNEVEQVEDFSINEIAKRPVMSLMESESLVKAMMLMERHGYSALPIISEGFNESVLGVITVRDIKYLALAQDGRQSENILNEPALKFVEFVRQEGIMPSEPYAFLPESASLQNMVDVFLHSQVKNTQTIHRLLLTDKKGRMCGMVTLTDIMRILGDSLGQFRRVPSFEQLPPSHPAHNRN
eukprot:GHVQ01022227.1.p1 GENE.GHVQ01022227.1~~GHVQ01022227.1.p1  ORF type:complete len:450 (-),score=85.42 GHVQ01022227.1:133-1482(-)